MKNIILKSVCALALVAFCTADASAQGLFKILEHATEMIQDITGSNDGKEETPADTSSVDIEARDFIASIPIYSVVEVVETDANGNTILNEDQTVRKTYRLVDQNGTICDPNTARKHLKAAMKSGATILSKVGVGAATGALSAKDSGASKKETLIHTSIGIGIGVLSATNDIKELKKQLKIRKQCLSVIAQYQKDFTEEGVPVDANADLSAYQDCETMTLPAQRVADQLLASQEEGGSMEEFSDEELEKLLSEADA